jgi:hypothetical protein
MALPAVIPAIPITVLALPISPVPTAIVALPAGLSPIPTAVVAMPTVSPVPAPVIGLPAVIPSIPIAVTALPPWPVVTIASSGPAIIFHAVNVTVGLVLHLVEPLPLTSRQVAVGHHPVLDPVDAPLLPVQVAGFPRG